MRGLPTARGEVIRVLPEWFSSWQDWELNLVACLSIWSVFALTRVERLLRDLDRELKEGAERGRKHSAHERREGADRGPRNHGR